MKRVNENPPARYPDRDFSESTKPWWVVKLKPRQEKACAFDFIEEGIEYYLPLYTKVTRRRDNNKPRKSILPLFPGYICFTADRSHDVYSSKRMVRLIEIQNQKKFIRELSQIRQILENNLPIQPLNESFSPGEEVLVKYGPLKGITGTIQTVMGERKLILSVEALGSASVTIDAAWVQANCTKS